MGARVMSQLTPYLTQPGYGDRIATVEGMDVAYHYEPADRDTGLPEVYVLSCIKVAGRWFSFEAFAEDFWLAVESLIPAALEADAVLAAEGAE